MMRSTSSLIPGYRYAPANLGNVVIIGLGKTGQVAADYCLDLLGHRVKSVTVWAGKTGKNTREIGENLARRGANVVYDSQEVTGSYDLCIASPGIPQPSSFYQSAQKASAEIISEVEFAWRESRTRTSWIAVTGTNGKTTVTSLISHILKTCGYNVKPVGNIGNTCLRAVQEDDSDVLVVETSSFQLASCVRFAPDIAVLLNITPDHIEWHKTFDAYVAAKMNILSNLKANHSICAVLDATNDVVRKKVKELRAQSDDQRGFAYIPVGSADGLSSDMRVRCGATNASFVREGNLVVAWNGTEHVLCSASDLQIPGQHNVDNALAAASAVIAFGANDGDVTKALKTFKPLEHRIEPCGTMNGISFFNDSKATNVDATLKALSAFSPRRPIVLLGGHDKGTDLAPLVVQAQKHCKAVICYGASKGRFLKAFQKAALPVYEASDGMESALDEAISLAKPGDIILLSPACSSFDEFSCYEQRGDAFKKLVAHRIADTEHRHNTENRQGE